MPCVSVSEGDKGRMRREKTRERLGDSLPSLLNTEAGGAEAGAGPRPGRGPGGAGCFRASPHPFSSVLLPHVFHHDPERPSD